MWIGHGDLVRCRPPMTTTHRKSKKKDPTEGLDAAAKANYYALRRQRELMARTLRKRRQRKSHQ